MRIVYSDKCLEYEFPEHPESPERIRKSYDLLRNRGFQFVKPEKASLNDLLLVHTQEHVNSVKNLDYYDIDTPKIPGIYEFACLSAGAATTAGRLAEELSFSLMRPPGHHVSSNSKPRGFCYFNNMAIAVKRLLEKYQKIAILDIDVHHGNGTQKIFSGDERVLFVSLHQSPLYPGTGIKNEENCLNFPLQPNTRKKQYLDKLEKALEAIKKFNPDILGISAGFDTYEKEKLSGLSLDVPDYFQVGYNISKLNLPTFSVLEGGYTDSLDLCIYNFLQGLKNARK